MQNLLIDEELEGLTEEERSEVLKILSEYASCGQSQSYDTLIYDDYAEIPVDIETFLHNPIYLGNGLTDDEGRFTVFPYWEEMLHKLFPTNVDTAYNTLVLTGAIGLGKSFIAVIALLYMMYRMLCLKDPYKHYGLQPIDLITFSFINITKDAAQGVAWNKCQQLVQSSPWFMSHGTLNKADEPVWQPNGGIELIYGSQPRHIIGRAVFCLDGDTKILTTKGEFTIKSLVGKSIKVYSESSLGQLAVSDDCTVVPTVKTDTECVVELTDGTEIRCTVNHRFLLTTGRYKEAQHLTSSDVLVARNFGMTLRTQHIHKITINKLGEPKQFYDVVEAAPAHNFFIRCKDGYVVSHNCDFDDEVSFQLNQDIEKQKEKAKALISSVDARMQSRFMKGEFLPTLHILASSKRTEQSFLETYIDKKKQNESKTTLIIDEPQWVIRNDKDSPRKFKVAVGNKFLDSEVLPLDVSEEEIQIYRDKGYMILDVPMGYYEQFVDDLDIALTDIAGISTTNSMNYINGVRWARCRKEGRVNPFTKEVIVVGNAPDDLVQYKDFFDLDRVDPNMKYKPLYVHLDMSLSGDKTGIGGVWILGKKPHQEGVPDSKELYYGLAFHVSVKAPKGHQVSFEKNRQFLYWLRENGFNVRGVSYDTYQSADLAQTLSAHNFNCSTISVDRLQDRICIPYLTFKNAIYEERIETYASKLLTDEIIGLVRDSNGKIDHSPSGINSKDSSDAVCGALYNASLHAAEFAFDYGEDMQEAVKMNTDPTGESIRQQIIMDFEEELKAAHANAVPKSATMSTNGFNPYISQGIIVF